MKLKLFIPRLTCLPRAYGAATLILSAITTIASVTQPSYAEGNRFFCSRSSGVPATFVRTSRGDIPMIRWISNAFSGSNYTPQERCQNVTARFQRYNDNGKLKFIRTGTVNRYPVLCVADFQGGNCDSKAVLVTLKRGRDPQLVLQRLLDLRARAAGRVIQLSGSQVIFYHDGEAYVDIEKLIDIAAVE